MAKEISGVLANTFPKVVVNTYKATKEGNFDETFKLQDKTSYLREVQRFVQSIPTIHAFLNILEIDTGYPLFPYALVSEETKNKMKEALKKVS